MAVNPSPLIQLERAWHRLMHTLAVTHPGRVAGGQAALKLLHDRMRVR